MNMINITLIGLIYGLTLINNVLGCDWYCENVACAAWCPFTCSCKFGQPPVVINKACDGLGLSSFVDCDNIFGSIFRRRMADDNNDNDETISIAAKIQDLSNKDKIRLYAEHLFGGDYFNYIDETISNLRHGIKALSQSVNDETDTFYMKKSKTDLINEMDSIIIDYQGIYTKINHLVELIEDSSS